MESTFIFFFLLLIYWFLGDRLCNWSNLILSEIFCCCLVATSCLTLLETPWTVAHQAPSVHGISKARQEWFTISFSRGSS